jgi:hypothetical protein
LFNFDTVIIRIIANCANKYYLLSQTINIVVIIGDLIYIQGGAEQR